MIKTARHILTIAAVTAAAIPTAAIASPTPAGNDQGQPVPTQTSATQVHKNGVFVVRGLGRLVKSNREH